MREKAIKTIEQLKTQYSADRFTFDMNIAMYLSGPSNKELRRSIYEILTNTERPPISKCGMYAISDLLKAKFEQFTLF